MSRTVVEEISYVLPDDTTTPFMAEGIFLSFDEDSVLRTVTMAGPASQAPYRAEILLFHGAHQIRLAAGWVHGSAHFGTAIWWTGELPFGENPRLYADARNDTGSDVTVQMMAIVEIP